MITKKYRAGPLTAVVRLNFDHVHVVTVRGKPLTARAIIATLEITIWPKQTAPEGKFPKVIRGQWRTMSSPQGLDRAFSIAEARKSAVEQAAMIMTGSIHMSTTGEELLAWPRHLRAMVWDVYQSQCKEWDSLPGHETPGLKALRVERVPLSANDVRSLFPPIGREVPLCSKPGSSLCSTAHRSTTS